MKNKHVFEDILKFTPSFLAFNCHNCCFTQPLRMGVQLYIHKTTGKVFITISTNIVSKLLVTLERPQKMNNTEIMTLICKGFRRVYFEGLSNTIIYWLPKLKWHLFREKIIVLSHSK